MQMLLFIAVALVLYFLSDWFLRELERRRGAPFDNRSLIFFFILLGLALVTFTALNHFLATPPADTTPHTGTPR